MKAPKPAKTPGQLGRNSWHAGHTYRSWQRTQTLHTQPLPWSSRPWEEGIIAPSPQRKERGWERVSNVQMLTQQGQSTACARDPSGVARPRSPDDAQLGNLQSAASSSLTPRPGPGPPSHFLEPSPFLPVALPSLGPPAVDPRRPLPPAAVGRQALWNSTTRTPLPPASCPGLYRSPSPLYATCRPP